MDARNDHARIKVLVIVPNLEVGGAETDLARNLPLIDRSRFEIVVLAYAGRGRLAASLRDAGIAVAGPLGRRARHSADMGPLATPGNPVRRWWLRAGALAGHLVDIVAIARCMRRTQPDIVHAVLPNAYLLAGVAAMFARRPPLVMSRVSLNWYQTPIFGRLERHVLHRLLTLAICNSAAIAQDLRAEGIPTARIRIIRNGVAAQAFTPSAAQAAAARRRLGIDADALAISVVANLHAYKGHADLLQALAMAREALPPDFVVLAAGRDIGGNLARMQALAQTLGLKGHVRFLGDRDDIPSILCAADIHVSASHTEGFPNNVLEAMCAGLPVLATAVGGVPEMVTDGKTGLLVPPRDRAAMAEALRVLASDAALRRSLGKAARDFVVTTYPIDGSARALEEAYREAAAKQRVEIGW